MRNADNTVNLTGQAPPRTVYVNAPPQGTDPAHIQIVDTEDGGVEIHDLRAERIKRRQAKGDKFHENLAEDIETGLLHMLAEEVISGIDSDIESRKGFISDLAENMDLLGLKTENSNTGRGGQSTSRVRHPALLEAVVKAQSQARAELLPSDGPVKIEQRDGGNSAGDQLAQSLERDMNWYLTKGAPEYYPDMDRGLFSFFFSGNLFKKVYRHPIRKRPVSECVSVSDLIVSQDATDLETAIRVTHRGFYTPNEMKKLMKRGFWLDCDVGTANPGLDDVQKKEDTIVGRNAAQARPEDAEHTVYETMLDYDLYDLNLDEPGADGPVPIIVTIDWDSRNILAVRRGWKKGDPDFMRRERYVHYAMVPALDFLALGYSHLLGNQTKALTAAWRILMDAGMLSNFPGGVKAKGVRTDNNEIAPNPGEFVDVDVANFDDISKAIMPLPYKGPDATFLQLAETITQDMQRLAGSVDAMGPEGIANAPVGTMLATVEQTTQVMSAVHKRLHNAQARELTLLRNLFQEYPEDLVKLNPNPQRQQYTQQEVMSAEIIPQSDPNIPAQIHRIMLATAMIQMAQETPGLYDPRAIHIRAWEMIGVNDIESVMMPANQPPPPPDPKVQLAQATLDLKKQQLAQNSQNQQLDYQQSQQAHQVDMAKSQMEQAQSEQEAQARQQLANQKMYIDQRKLELQQQQLNQKNQQAVLDHHAKMAQLAHKVGTDSVSQAAEHVHQTRLHQIKADHEAAKATADHEHQRAMAQETNAHQANMSHAQMQHDATMGHNEGQLKAGMAGDANASKLDLAETNNSAKNEQLAQTHGHEQQMFNAQAQEGREARHDEQSHEAHQNKAKAHAAVALQKAKPKPRPKASK